MHHILVVDNDPLQCRSIELSIKRLLGYKTTTLPGGKEAIEFLTSSMGDCIDVVVLDLSMPEVDGMQVLKAVKSKRPNLPIIINTAYGNVSKAVEAVQQGAADFVEKQDDPQRIKVAIEKALKVASLHDELSRLNRAERGQLDFSDIIGNGAIIEETRKLSRQASRSNISVLIKGESGVGKELFARAIHGASMRAGKPFIAVNCGAIPDNLIESVLFGHEKGSFTGATEKTIGKFREADGGTIFLDEIGELKPELQVKLLRVLQQGEVEPVGANRPVEINVRIISATNKSLKQMVKEGKFREDLYYRLNVFPITIPALRERKDDINALVDYFIKRVAAAEKKNISGITPEARKVLASYNWPGNIRQLQNALYRAIVLSDKPLLDLEDFTQITDALGRVGLHPKVAAANANSSDNTLLSLVGIGSDFKTISEIEKEVILKALDYYSGRIAKISRKLGIGRSTLYRKMDEYEIRAQKELPKSATA